MSVTKRFGIKIPTHPSDKKDFNRNSRTLLNRMWHRIRTLTLILIGSFTSNLIHSCTKNQCNFKIFSRYQTTTCTFMWFNNLFRNVLRALLSTLHGMNCYLNNLFEKRLETSVLCLGNNLFMVYSIFISCFFIQDYSRICKVDSKGTVLIN